jgi:hypothetical protein
LGRNHRQALGSNLFQSWDKVGDILCNKRLDTGDGRTGRFAGVSQGIFELVLAAA